MRHFFLSLTQKFLPLSNPFPLGIAAMLATTVIWASWILSSKMALSLDLTASDLAFMRYGVPSLVFLYFSFKSRAVIFATPAKTIILICAGAGLPFFFLATWGMQYAPAADAGILIPGSFPLFVTLISSFKNRKAPSSAQSFGVALITLGVVVLMAPKLSGPDGMQLLIGHLLYLLASFAWSIFTVALRDSDIPPLAASGLFCSSSTIVLLALLAFGMGDVQVDRLINSEHSQAIIHIIVVQGFLVGTLASFLFSYAVKVIGTRLSSVIGSLAPALVVLFSGLLLGESIDAAAITAVILVLAGVLVSTLQGISMPSLHTYSPQQR
ncbi:DMT family transporter [Agaribacterium haliotis]|uniref:DMT family transporter n=1 Tax=Agaribacterium haliotis TaxID=2013869 RepID=UPI001177B8B6|nr:DMT family transporter [Agaribacterium haliotis]